MARKPLGRRGMSGYGRVAVKQETGRPAHGFLALALTGCELMRGDLSRLCLQCLEVVPDGELHPCWRVPASREG